MSGLAWSRSSAQRLLIGAGVFLTPLLGVYANKALAPLVLICGLAALIQLWRDGQIRLLAAAPLGWIMAVLLVWALVSSPWALDRRDALSTTVGIAPILLTGLALSVAANRADQIASSGFAVLAGSGTGLAALGAFVYVHLFAIHRSIAAWFGRDIDYWPASVSAGSIVLAILVWPAAMALWRHGRRRWAGLLIALVAVVLLAGIAVTAKLALILGAFAALVVYFGGRWAVLLLAVPMLAATLLAPLWPLALRPDWHEAWLAPLSGSGLHRLYIWQFVAERIAEKPLLGWGMDAARSLPGQERTIPDGFGRVLQLHPHNFALQVWVELGLVGALAFAASIGLIVRAIAGMTADPIARAGAAATLVAAFVVASSSFGIWQNWWLAGLGLIAAFCVAACRAPHAAIGSAGRLR